MKKILFLLALILAWRFFSQNTSLDIQDPPPEKEVKNNIFKEKELHQAMKKIMEKKKEMDRQPTSDTALSADFEEDLNLKIDQEIGPDEDYVAQAQQLSHEQLKSSIAQLELEIEADEILIEQMELDKHEGLSISNDDIERIVKRAEHKKEKLDIFINQFSYSKEP